MMHLQVRKAFAQTLGAIAALSLAACAGGPETKKDDAAAAARSQAFMDKVGTYSVDALAEAKSCSVPAAADKPAMAKEAGPSKEWKTLLGHANGCVKARDWKTLETLANAIARIDIDSPWGAYYLSVAAEGTGEFQRAMWMVDLAQKKAGGRSGLFSYQKGRIFLAMKETTRAMKEIQGAVAVDPRLVDGHVYLAEIHHRDQEHDKAAGYYQAALQVHASNYRALTGLAETRLALGDGKAAAELYEKALAMKSSDVRAWTRLAFIYESVQKSPAQALSAYKNLRSALPKSSDKPDFDVNAKIKTIEESMQPRVPAQASTQTVDENKKVK